MLIIEITEKFLLWRDREEGGKRMKRPSNKKTAKKKPEPKAPTKPAKKK